MNARGDASPGDENEVLDCHDHGALLAQVEQHDAHIAELKARATAAKCELHIVTGRDGTGVFVISRWGLLSRELRDVAAVADWLDRIGAP